MTVFETFGTFGQILPGNSFLQAQLGMENPTHTATAPRAVYWRTASARVSGRNRVWGECGRRSWNCWRTAIW